MTRAVLAERWWINDKGNQTVGPAIRTSVTLPFALGFIYVIYAAWRQSPAGATLGVVASVGLKL